MRAFYQTEEGVDGKWAHAVALDHLIFVEVSCEGEERAAELHFVGGEVRSVSAEMGLSIIDEMKRISLRQAMVDAGWRPKEEAPKTGVMIMCRDIDEHGIFVARWGVYENDPEKEGWFNYDFLDEASEFNWWRPYDGPPLDAYDWANLKPDAD